MRWSGWVWLALTACRHGVDTFPDTGFVFRDTAAPSPGRDTSAPVADADCPPQLSPSCHIEQGVCVDEATKLDLPRPDAAAVDAIRAAHASGACTPELLAPCASSDGTEGLLHATVKANGFAVDVYDAHGWVAGWVPAGPQLSYVDCDETWWLGDLRWRDCAQSAMSALYGLTGSCVAGVEGTCGADDCLHESL